MMTKDDFIKWLTNNTSFRRLYSTSDDVWVNEVDYEKELYDEIRLEFDIVYYSFEEFEYDSTTTTVVNEYTYEDFIKYYKC